MFSFEICETFKNTYFEEHLPADSSINERLQETHALLGKKSKSDLINLWLGQRMLHQNYSYLN